MLCHALAVLVAALVSTQVMHWLCARVSPAVDLATYLAPPRLAAEAPHHQGLVGPEFVDFGGLSCPLLPYNLFGKVRGFAPHSFQCPLR